MAIITADLRIRKALSSCVPKSTDLAIEVGDLVRVFRETGKRYVGSYPLIRVDGTCVFIINNHYEVKFNMHQALLASTYDNILSEENRVTSLHSSLLKLSSNRLCKSSTANRNEIPSVLITEVLHYNDP